MESRAITVTTETKQYNNTNIIITEHSVERYISELSVNHFLLVNLINLFVFLLYSSKIKLYLLYLPKVNGLVGLDIMCKFRKFNLTNFL